MTLRSGYFLRINKDFVHRAGISRCRTIACVLCALHIVQCVGLYRPSRPTQGQRGAVSRRHVSNCFQLTRSFMAECSFCTLTP